MFFASFIWPILDSAATVCLAWLELLKGKISVKITKVNKEISDVLEPEDPPARQIGFCVSAISEDEDEEEEYYD